MRRARLVQQRRERVLVELRALHRGDVLVEQRHQRPGQAGLGLAALTQEHDVLAREDGVLDGRDDRVLVAHDTREEHPAVRQPRHQVVAQLLLHGARPVAGGTQRAERGGQVAAGRGGRGGVGHRRLPGAEGGGVRAYHPVSADGCGWSGAPGSVRRAGPQWTCGSISGLCRPLGRAGAWSGACSRGGSEATSAAIVARTRDGIAVRGRGQAGEADGARRLALLQVGLGPVDAIGELRRDAPREVLEGVRRRVPRGEHRRRAALDVPLAVPLDGPQVVGGDDARPGTDGRVHDEHRAQSPDRVVRQPVRAALRAGPSRRAATARAG